jgi:hypothetical protein
MRTITALFVTIALMLGTLTPPRTPAPSLARTPIHSARTRTPVMQRTPTPTRMPSPTATATPRPAALPSPTSSIVRPHLTLLPDPVLLPVGGTAEVQIYVTGDHPEPLYFMYGTFDPAFVTITHVASTHNVTCSTESTGDYANCWIQPGRDAAAVLVTLRGIAPWSGEAQVALMAGSVPRGHAWQSVVVE